MGEIGEKDLGRLYPFSAVTTVPYSQAVPQKGAFSTLILAPIFLLSI